MENRMVVEGLMLDAYRQSAPERRDCYDGFFCYNRDCKECLEEYDDVRTLCDIYKCSECPRYGDDCDGEGEDEWED